MDDPRPLGIERTDPGAYKKKLLDLLGDRDPISVLSETPSRLSEIVNHTHADRLKTRPFPGKWTPNEVIGHLSDAEWVLGMRIRHVLSEDSPPLPAMDQDRWVAAQCHNDREPSELVEMFSGLRLFNLGIWHRIGPDEMKRAGIHSERGMETLETMLPLYAGHDLSHLDQIARYLEAIEKAG